MSRFNTGNPIDSNDPRDLSDNAKNLDQGINSNDLTFTDRLGNSRQSWAGMESEFQADQDDKQDRFNAFIASSGYQFVGDYDTGIELTEYNQVVRDTNGEFWRVSGSQSLPYTTTGAGLPEGGAFVTVGDAALRQELDGDVANGQGARLVRGAVIYVDTVADLKGLQGVEPGVVVKTKGYYEPGDGGGNDYEIVDAGTGDDDGGYFIDLSDASAQARGIFGDSVNILKFGAQRGGESAENIQAAIDFCENFSLSKQVFVPSGVFRVNKTLKISESNIVIFGTQSKDYRPIGGSTKSTLIFDLDDGVDGIIIENVGGSTIGCAVKGVSLQRSSKEEKGAGGRGLVLRNAVSFFIENVLVNDFDIGVSFEATEQGRSRDGIVTGLTVWDASSVLIRIRGLLDTSFYACNCKQGDPGKDYLVLMQDSPSGMGAEALHFHGCFFISPHVSEAIRIRGDNYIWLTFVDCVIEGGGSTPVGVSAQRGSAENLNQLSLYFVNCWFNGFTESAITLLDTSVMSTNTRFHVQGESPSYVVRLVGRSGTTHESKTIISGGIIANNSGEGDGLVQITRTQGAIIQNTHLISLSGEIRGVVLDSGAVDCVIRGNTHRAGDAFPVAGQSLFENYVEYDGWRSDKDLYLSRTDSAEAQADSSGEVSYAHGISGLRDRLLFAEAVFKNQSGNIEKMTFDFADGSQIKFSGADAGADVRILIRYTRTASW